MLMNCVCVLNAKLNNQLIENTLCFQQLICKCVHKIVITFPPSCNIPTTLPPDAHNQTVVSTFASLTWKTRSSMSSTKPSY